MAGLLSTAINKISSEVFNRQGTGGATTGQDVVQGIRDRIRPKMQTTGIAPPPIPQTMAPTTAAAQPSVAAARPDPVSTPAGQSSAGGVPTAPPPPVVPKAPETAATPSSAIDTSSVTAVSPNGMTTNAVTPTRDVPVAPSAAPIDTSSVTPLAPGAMTTNAAVPPLAAAPSSAMTTTAAPVAPAVAAAAAPPPPPPPPAPAAPAAAAPVSAPAATGIAPAATPGAPAAASPTASAAPSGVADPTSVTQQLNDITGSGSAYMRQAELAGTLAAARRGGLNTSIAAGSARAAAISAAMPLAQQEATTAANRELQNKDIAAQKDRIQLDADAQMERLKTSLAGADAQQKRQIEADMAKVQFEADAAMARLDKQGTLDQASQLRDITSKMDQLKYSTNAADQQQYRDLAAQKERLTIAGEQALQQIGAQGVIQFSLADKNNQAELSRLQMSLTSSDNQQAKAIAADMVKTQTQGQQEMDRLKAQLAGADAQQTRDIQAQMARLQVSVGADLNKLQIQGQQALQQIGAQGAVAKDLASFNNSAEMQRLTTSLTSSENVAARNIAAEMDRLTYSTNSQVDQLKMQLANSNDQQKKELQSRIDQIQAQSVVDMQKLQTQGEQALTQIGAQGSNQMAVSAQDNAGALQRAREDMAARSADLDKQIASATGQQKTDLEAQKERLQISGQQEIDRLNKAAELDKGRIQYQASLDSVLSAQGAQQQQALTTLQGNINSALQGQTDTAAFQRLNDQLKNNLDVVSANSAADIQKLSMSGGQQMAQLLQTQQGDYQKLSMQLANGDKTNIASLAAGIFKTEADMRAALLSNPNMPASERAAYEQMISKMGDPLRSYIDQLYAPPPPPANGGIAPSGGNPAATPAGTPPASGGTSAPLPPISSTGNTGIAPPTAPTAGGALTPDQIVYKNGKYTGPNGETLNPADVQKIYQNAGYSQ